MDKINIFFLGIIAAFGALLLELAALAIFFRQTALADNFYSEVTFFLIAIVFMEEIIKLAFVRHIFVAVKNYGNILQNSLLFGAGFAVAEAVFLHFNDFFISNGLRLQLAGIIFIHLLTSGLMGYILQKSRGALSTACLFALICAFFIHLFYNMAIIYLTPLQ